MQASPVPTWQRILVVALLMLPGCTRLSQEPGLAETARGPGYATLPPARMAPDGVALEIAVATLDGERLEQFNKVWEKADVQILPLEKRKQLDANGFRIGLLGTSLPADLTAALSWSQPLITSEGDVLYNSKSPLPANASTIYSVKQIERLRPGDEHWVPCSSVHNQLDWNIQVEDQSRSGICEQAQCGFALSQMPAGDSMVKLWLHPVIRYGEQKLRYGVDQDTLLFQEKRKALRLGELDIVHRLRLGQTLVLTSTQIPHGVGQKFFASARFSASRQVLLIRPVQMGQDDLFSPERTTRRLSTSLD